MEPRPHPWNEGFTWQRTERESLRLLGPDQVEYFHEHGYVLVEGALDAGTLAEVTAVLDERAEATEAFLRQFPDDRLSIAEAGAILFSPHPVLASEVARRFAAHPVFAELCHDLVGDDVRLYWDQLVYKQPEKPRHFPWHQDNGYTYVEPQQYLTCWVPLTDTTIDNGCPWVAPGLHRLGTLAHEWGPAVRVVTVTVGMIVTDEAAAFYGDAGRREAIGGLLAAGRMGEPEDVADMCLVLASPLARWVTGTEVEVHGGDERPGYLDALADD